MRADEELRRVYRITIGGDNLIVATFLEVVMDTEEHTRGSELFVEDMITIFEKNPRKKFKMLVDLSPIKGAYYISNDARKAYLRLARRDEIAKAAIVGASPLMGMVINIFLNIAGKHRERFFDDKGKALAWLGENNQRG